MFRLTWAMHAIVVVIVLECKRNTTSNVHPSVLEGPRLIS